MKSSVVIIMGDGAECGICSASYFAMKSMKRWSPSPYINRFLSADTIVPGYANPQNLNRYSYVLNNPVKLTDPTGHRCVGEVEECEDEDGHPINGAGGGEGGTGGDGSHNDPQDMQTSESGVDFIIYWENAGGPPDSYPYEDAGGTCTIGYGHVLYNPGKGCSGWPNKIYKDEERYPNGLSLAGAQAFLAMDIDNAEALIKKTITADLTQAQFDALVSYIFNSGDQTNQPFIQKGIPGLINRGNHEGVAEAIASGPITSGNPPITLDILTERRQAEVNLYLNGIYIP